MSQFLEIITSYERGIWMTYVYFIDSANRGINIDNSTLFKYIQDLELQEAQIFAEISGEQEAFKMLLETIEEDDIIIVRSIEDLGSNLLKILKFLNVLSKYNIELISVEEHYYNAKLYSRLIKDLLRISTDLQTSARQIGYQAAIEKGKVGRPKSDSITEALKLYDTRKLTIEQISKISKISQSTLYRAIRDRRENLRMVVSS